MAFSLSLHTARPSLRTAGKHRAANTLPRLVQKERVLGRYESPAGSAIATEHALVISAPERTSQRIAWAAVAQAAWSPVDQSFTLKLWPDGHEPPLHVRLAADRRLAVIIRERVQFHRVLSVPIALPGGISGQVDALRDGNEVRWRVFADAPLDTPALRDACDVAIAEIRSLAGL